MTSRPAQTPQTAVARMRAGELVEAALARHRAAGTLPMSGGLISRNAIAKELDIQGIVRTPEVEAVFAAADRRLGHQAGSSSKYDILAPQLERALSNGEVGLRNGRPTHVWAASQLGVTAAAIRHSHALKRVLDAYKPAETVKEDVRSIPSISWERSEAALRLLGDSRAQISAALSTQFSGLARPTATKRWAVFFEFLHWLHERSDLVLEQWASGMTPSPTELGRAAWRWRDEIESLDARKVTTRSRLIADLNNVLNLLERAGIAPSILDLSPIKNARRKTSPRRTVAQNELQAIVTLVDDEARALGLDAWSEDKQAFLESLREEADDSTAQLDLVDRIRHLNRARLDTIRRAAETTFLAGRSKWEAGQLAVAATQGMQVPTVAKLASLSDELEQEILLGLYLRAVQASDDGLIPRGNAPRAQDHPAWAHHKIWQRLGGYYHVAAHLHATSDTTAAAIILYLVESGANAPVGRTLLVSALSPSTQSGFTTVVGHKSTANGRAIRADLQNKDPARSITAVEALEAMSAMSAPLRKAASPAHSDLLFLVRGKRHVTPVLGYTLRDQFALLIAQDPSLSRNRITPAMLRPSILLDMALAREGRIEQVQSFAQHATLSETDGYTRKYAVRLLYEERVRRYQTALEALAADGISGAAEKLGHEPDMVRNLAEEARQTGLGVLCSAPRKGLQPGTDVQNNCDRLEACPDCQARLVVAEPEAISDLILFNQALRLAEPDWSSSRPERWQRYWLPWLALTEVVLEKMERGPLAKTLDAAKALADRRRAEGEALVQPW